jgi:signal peptidase II
VSRGGRGAAILFASAGAVWILDRLSKLWVENALAGRPPVTVIPGILDLRFTLNSGGAFSIGQSAPWLFAGATILVSALIVATAWRHTSPTTSVALGLILGGALGNLTDRITRGPRLTGKVVDFIDVQVWPVFNVADSAVVVGAILLAFSSMRDGERSGTGASDTGAGDEGGAVTSDPGDPVTPDAG